METQDDSPNIMTIQGKERRRNNNHSYLMHSVIRGIGNDIGSKRI
jgi:hypothetical protein